MTNKIPNPNVKKYELAKRTAKFGFLALVLAGLFLFAKSALAVDYTWSLGANGNWTTNTNWTPNGVPGSGAGDTATIDTNYTVTLSSAPANSLTSITLSNDAALNLTGTTWTLSASAITLNDTSDIIVDEDNAEGNLITISGTNLTVASGASINANETGYGPDLGPGAGGGTGDQEPGGGGYGGAGGAGSVGAGGAAYGSSSAPTDLGSGGGSGGDPSGNGGGAIRLNISGTLTNNGTISANGGSGSANCGTTSAEGGAGGSGGSIWVTTGTLAGSGTFSANGGNGQYTGYCTSGGGGGGRIVIEVGPSSASACSLVTRAVSGGAGYNAGSAGTNYCGALSGTLTSSKYDTS